MILVPLSTAFVLRLFLNRRFVNPLPPLDRSRRQFQIELALLVGVGMTIALYSTVVMQFPFVHSGLKLVLGFLTLGLFQSVDLALERERSVILQAKALGYGHAPPAKLFPLTRRFLQLTILMAFLISGVLILIIVNDLRWLTLGAMLQENLFFLVRAVIVEILFVMSVLLALIINLTVSYAKNLKLLLDNQTTVLEQISKGDLSGYVPAVTNDELGFIAGHTNRMLEGLREHLEMTHGMEVARQIQADLLPFSAPEIPGLDIAGISIPTDAVTGDYFDYFRTRDEKQLSVLIGDVSGHGVGSALIMASVRAMIRLRTALPGSLSEVMADVNQMTVEDNYGTGRFMTLFCLMIDTSSFSLRWAGAGHDPALLYSPAKDSFTELPSSGLPLGIRQDSAYPVSARDIFLPDEIIVMGTDGIWETTNQEVELYGKDRLRQIIRAHAAGSAQEIVEEVVKSASAFSDGELKDDLTLVVVKALNRKMPRGS
ncbi:sigma-B regulation protein RsbU (phosphoserine phosphatase) [Desulfonatronum thiosulfatophilum]|uniref:Sigma-B regulation protein RsbU (Phosphoserine phosphatase) n=2 Tax=Desulfonatronum thiosulfatophilum TaxID=617002 RepID=A0A1G6AJ47_9BACT|nr:SpoIIE family protein phosphatase [Desulfonatronum thiosulfatophilum]SDB08385.1 sigma-B regulation protein RsbU (phosphoserine phosphatase) [Desulfonatronum thiosulfatophilum]